jgi:queuine/archaeosine tRNA-ribosyltransferase
MLERSIREKKLFVLLCDGKCEMFFVVVNYGCEMFDSFQRNCFEGKKLAGTKGGRQKVPLKTKRRLRNFFLNNFSRRRLNWAQLIFLD